MVDPEDQVLLADSVGPALPVPFVRRVLVNGAAGVPCVVEGRLMSLMAFTVTDGRIAAIDVLSDPDRLDAIDLAPLL